MKLLFSPVACDRCKMSRISGHKCPAQTIRIALFTRGSINCRNCQRPTIRPSFFRLAFYRFVVFSGDIRGIGQLAQQHRRRFFGYLFDQLGKPVADFRPHVIQL